MHTSFFGRKDTELFERLRGELPGILRWSLDGLQRLREHGLFVQLKTWEHGGRLRSHELFASAKVRRSR